MALTASALLLAVALGVTLAESVPIGLAMLLALLYAPVVFLNLPVAIGLWLPLAFFEGLPGVRLGPEAAGILITLGWIATLLVYPEQAKEVVRRHRVLFTGLAGFLIWIGLSLAWAKEVGPAAGYLWPWFEVALFLTIVATAVSEPRHVRLLLTGFVLGAAASVLIGLLGQGLGTAATAELAQAGRLQGGAGDPNYLAAGLVPALALGVGLIATTRNPAGRWWLAVAIAVLMAGLASSESRGGLIAGLVCALLAVIVFKKSRLATIGGLVALIVVAGAWFMANPAAWQRVTETKADAGSGRVDLWRIGWRMIGDYPVAGVGLRNFGVEAPQYTRAPGVLRFVKHVERRQEPHNVYLALWAETGVIGLLLFLIVPVGALRAASLAAKRFDQLGDTRMAVLSRVALLGLAGMLTASFFLPNGTDKRLWFLMGICLALLASAQRQAAARGLLTSWEAKSTGSHQTPSLVRSASRASTPFS